MSQNSELLFGLNGFCKPFDIQGFEVG